MLMAMLTPQRSSMIEEANYQRFLEFSTRKKPIIRVTLQEDTYQIDREGIIVLASELSLAEIGELFFLLESSDAEFASDDGVKVDCKLRQTIRRQTIRRLAQKLKLHRTTFSDSLSLSFISPID